MRWLRRGGPARPIVPPRALGLLFLVVVTLLLLSNGSRLLDNQRELKWDRRLGFRGRDDLLILAQKARHPTVRHRLATHYQLGQLLAGAKLYIPYRLRGQTWLFEGLAELEVEPLQKTPELPAPVVRELARTAPIKTQLDRAPLYLLPGKRARRYVLAREHGGKVLVLLPVARYLAAGGSLGGEGGP